VLSDKPGRLQPDTNRQEEDFEAFPQDIIVFSNADWDHSVRTNSQHMAERFALRGFRVLYVESLGLRRPSAAARDLKRMGKRLMRGLACLRCVSDRVWVYSPLVIPFHGSRAIRAVNQWLIRGILKLIVRSLRFKHPIVWTYNPLVHSFWDGLDGSLFFYHCVDDLASVPGVPRDPVRAAEETIVGKADAVFTTSRELCRRLSNLYPNKTHCLTNVVDFAHFAKARAGSPLPRDLEAIPQPRIGFIGTISSYKVDVDLILDVADRRPDWHWVLVGLPGAGISHSLGKLMEKANVHVLGHRDYSALPDYLRGIDVATIPCKLNEYTRSMFPMKFFEYLAAGKPVVITPLDALMDYADACVTAATAEEFCEAIERILAGERPDKEMCARLAAEHTWDTRLDVMLHVMEQSWLSKERDKGKTAGDA
jgi:glycosyltransferase involved in cell wall biosynthesis